METYHASPSLSHELLNPLVASVIYLCCPPPIQLTKRDQVMRLNQLYYALNDFNWQVLQCVHVVQCGTAHLAAVKIRP
jgi:hypothetical protein